MRVREISGYFLTGMCAVILASGSVIPAQANMLSGIDIHKNEKGNSSIILNLEKNTGIKKTVISADSVKLVLSGVSPSKSAQIAYNGVSGIKNIIIQKKNADNTGITIEGGNISQADIFIREASDGRLIPAGINKFFWDFNTVTGIFSAFALCILFFMMKNKERREKNSSIKSAMNAIRRKNEERAQSKTVSRNCSSLPEDFTINRYMENERLKKAG